MAELSVIVVGMDEEQRAILQIQINGTAVARVVESYSKYPVAANDLVLRRIQDARPSIIVVDIAKGHTQAAIHAIELFRNGVQGAAVFAVGESNQAQVVISSMRAGAREYLERPTSTTSLLEAFVRVTASQRKHEVNMKRGKVFTFVNSKGGSGSTTLAVNTAVALKAEGKAVALLDLAPIGHAALLLNAKPAFTVADALRSAERMDRALLETLMTRCDNGLHLLAGATEPLPDDRTTTELARLFDVMVSNFDYVVVDASSRMDHAVRFACDISESVLLVATPDVMSLWSAARVQQYLSQGLVDGTLRLVINRFRKIPGFGDDDIEAATSARLFHKIPNNYQATSGAIDRGVPVVQQNHSELARCYKQLAGLLTNPHEETKRKSFSLFG